MWMNAYEIDEAVETLEVASSEFVPYARYLSDWRDTVNENSDGWAHWRAGTKCADKLSALVKQAFEAVRHGGDAPSVEDFPAALRPIKSAATRHKLPAPTLGEVPSQVPGMR